MLRPSKTTGWGMACLPERDAPGLSMGALGEGAIPIPAPWTGAQQRMSCSHFIRSLGSVRGRSGGGQGLRIGAWIAGPQPSRLHGRLPHRGFLGRMGCRGQPHPAWRNILLPRAPKGLRGRGTTLPSRMGA